MVAVSTGSVPLASLGFDRLEVRCTRCPRRGRYRVASLLAKHGADIGLPALAGLVLTDWGELSELANRLIDRQLVERQRRW